MLYLFKHFTPHNAAGQNGQHLFQRFEHLLLAHIRIILNLFVIIKINVKLIQRDSSFYVFQ